jgi:hypothetical protein
MYIIRVRVPRPPIYWYQSQTKEDLLFWDGSIGYCNEKYR